MSQIKKDERTPTVFKGCPFCGGTAWMDKDWKPGKGFDSTTKRFKCTRCSLVHFILLDTENIKRAPSSLWEV